VSEEAGPRRPRLFGPRLSRPGGARECSLAFQRQGSVSPTFPKSLRDAGAAGRVAAAACDLESVKALHEQDLREGGGKVYLPYALSAKYVNAPREWGWQFVFPAPEHSVDPPVRGSASSPSSREMDPEGFQEAVRKAGLGV
jgi:hypothetical protein